MKTTASPYVLHVFVCTAKKEKGSFCGAHGSDELRIQIKEWSGQTYGKRVRISSSGCMGQCESGIAVALYPTHEMLLEVRSHDLEAIKDQISKSVAKLETL